jgi:N-acetylglucosaminyl-diphospho-decaprenol L-rhamnosyltransferase
MLVSYVSGRVAAGARFQRRATDVGAAAENRTTKG